MTCKTYLALLVCLLFYEGEIDLDTGDMDMDFDDFDIDF